MVEYLIVAAAALGCVAGAGQPLIAAHRGGMDSAYPENTLPAFHHAVAAGADLIELDVRTTRDGHAVVLHDMRVDRTTDGTGFVHQLDLATVARLDAGGGARVPTLLDTLDAMAAQDVALLLDIKRDAPGLSHAKLVDTVVERYPAQRVMFGVRTLEDLGRFAAQDAGLRFLGLVPQPADIDAFLAAGVEAIRLWPAWLTREPELAERIHAAGARVWVTTGPAEDEVLEALAKLGADVLLTDRPVAARALFGCR